VKGSGAVEEEVAKIQEVKKSYSDSVIRREMVKRVVWLPYGHENNFKIQLCFLSVKKSK
jgi:hypothetical protein